MVNVRTLLGCIGREATASAPARAYSPSSSGLTGSRMPWTSRIRHAVLHAVVAHQKLAITRAWELRHETAAQRERRQLFARREDPLDHGLDGAGRVTRDEVVDLPQIFERA